MPLYLLNTSELGLHFHFVTVIFLYFYFSEFTESQPSEKLIST